MFGKNDIRGVVNSPLLQVHKIFSTIQGEGPWSGYPAIFVRLSGCNLRCFFCDTQWGDESDPYMSVKAIVEEIEKEYNRTKVEGAEIIKRVILTGGEPARQNCNELLIALGARDWQTQIETAGTYFPDWFGHLDQIVISPKTKHVHKDFYKDHNLYINWKYVIRAGEVSAIDGLPNSCTQVHNPDDPSISAKQLKVLDDKYGVPARPPKGVRTWVSPCNEHDEVKNAANRKAVAESCMKFGYRAMVQLHNYLEVE